ncbi:MAG: DUF3822 family protein [Chitinophagaceae bacterium]
MSTPVFDIIHDELASVDRLDCRLLIEVNPHYFYYTVLKSDNRVMALKYYQLTYNNNQEMVNSLEETLNDDPLLKEKMKECLVVFNWPENCLVPRKYFDKDLNKEMLGLLHGNVNKGMMMSEKINGGEIYTIYRIPPVLDDFFQRRFPGCNYRHYYTLLLECSLKEELSAIDYVSIIFNTKEITASVFINKQLQVIQNLPYQTSEDIAWQLLNIYQQFDLKQEETPLQVGGMIDKNSAMYEELLKYFQSVHTDTLPTGISVPSSFESFPEHFFSPILKLALCVS